MKKILKYLRQLNDFSQDEIAKKIGLKKGQKVRVYIEESQNDEKRKKAWETLMSFKGSLPEDFLQRVQSLKNQQ